MKLTLSIMIEKSLAAYRSSSRNANTYEFPIVLQDYEGNSYEIKDFAVDLDGGKSLIKISQIV